MIGDYVSRAATAVLSTENLLHNLSVIKSYVPGKQIIAMIKANAYGHGLRSTAMRLCQHVDMLGVASIDEALILRKIGIKTRIFLAEGVFKKIDLAIAAAEGFDVVFHDHLQVDWLLASALKNKIRAWVKVDSGMGRLGFVPDEVQMIIERLVLSGNIYNKLGIMSHFACADDPSNAKNVQQEAVFNKTLTNTCRTLQDLNKDFELIVSFCNSPALMTMPDCQYDVIRPGLAIYGASPIKGMSAGNLNLKPVMTLRTQLISIKQHKAGSTIGYGGRYICPEDMHVGVIAFGYGDGYPRSAQDGTPILVNGVRCSIVGRVSMDMITIDLRNCPSAVVGDTVVLWGDGLPIEDVAIRTSNVAYDMLTGVQHRVKFYWTEVSV